MTRLHRVFCFATSLAFTLLGLLPSMSRAGTWVAFQSSYTRGTGAPITVTNTFTLLNPSTQYTLKAFNGGLQNDTSELVSYSVVYLNGTQVVGPANFNQNVAEVNVTISPGLTNTLAVQVRGKPGGVLTIQVIGVDNDPPTITASVNPSPNAAGWNNSPVTVTFTCSDKTSGVASCSAPVTVLTEAANQVVSGTATDLAGNTASTSVTVNLDMTPPTITGSVNPPPDAGGYNSGPVTVTFNCADPLSGVATCSTPVSVSNEGATPVPGTATDVAGNTVSITITVNISLSYFKIQSWQTGPNGNAKSPSGKCLDYGTSPSGNGATVFLNDCSSAHSIRVVELSENMFPDGQVCSYEDAQMNCFHHEVLLYAGRSVIGIKIPLAITQGGTSGPSQPATEYELELQPSFTSIIGGLISSPVNQLFRLDGDSVILEGVPGQPGIPAQRTPCINTVSSTTLCPPAAPQFVIQVQNSRGTSGSPLVAAVRNLSDNEFWDFVPQPGSGPYPTSGFVSTACSPPVPIATADALVCALSNAAWGSVVIVSSPNNDCVVTDPLSQLKHDIGACIDLSQYPPLALAAGSTIRGDRRGTHFGPQLYGGYSQERPLDCDGNCILEVIGDYARVTGLRVRGQSRSIGENSGTLSANNGISVHYAGVFPASPSQSLLASVTELIVTIDHNDISDWITGAIRVNSPFADSSSTSNACTYVTYVDSAGNQGYYPCDGTVFYPPAPPGTAYAFLAEDPVCPPEGPLCPPTPPTLGNVRVARNFLHHNSSSETGYGIEMGNTGGRFLAEGNTFSWNRHDITASGEPHSEYRALNNLVLSGAPVYPNPFNGRLQDFDVHGTDNVGGIQGQLYFGGTGGYYVEVAGNTFLGGDGHDYVLRGYPAVSSYYHDNVSRRKENDAIHFIHCFDLGCVNDYTAQDFPIIISNSQFGQSTPDPTATLGVGDFDGDGDDDLFMATGTAWFYSSAGQREWRYLNSAEDTIDQLLFGDFDGDGRTDVLGLRSGQLFVSWGGISAFELLNANVPANCTLADMAVGDFDGDGKPDIFCADWRNNTWWVSYGGNTTFVPVQNSSFRRQDLLFGDFDGNGTTDVFGVTSNVWSVSYSPKLVQACCFSSWTPLPVSLTTTANGLVVADFNGDGIADVGTSCGPPLTVGWQISYAGAQSWSNCNTFGPSSTLGSLSCNNFILTCFTLANGAVGRFSGGPGADILLWNYYNSQGAAPLWDAPGGTGIPYVLSSQDMH